MGKCQHSDFRVLCVVLLLSKRLKLVKVLAPVGAPALSLARQRIRLPSTSFESSVSCEGVLILCCRRGPRDPQEAPSHDTGYATGLARRILDQQAPLTADWHGLAPQKAQQSKKNSEWGADGVPSSFPPFGSLFLLPPQSGARQVPC